MGHKRKRKREGKAALAGLLREELVKAVGKVLDEFPVAGLDVVAPRAVFPEALKDIMREDLIQHGEVYACSPKELAWKEMRAGAEIRRKRKKEFEEAIKPN